MGRQPLHVGRAIGPSLAIGLPAAALFAVLAGLGLLDPPTALVAFLAVAFLGFAAMLIRQADLDALGGYLDELLGRDDAPPPTLRFSPLARDLAHGLDRLNRARAERIATLEAEARELGRVLDTLPDPLILVAADRRILRVNAAARELLGAELDGRDLATALRNPAVLDAVDAATASGPGRAVEFSLAEPVERDFIARIEPRRDHGPGEIATILTLHDVTAGKRAEQMRADFVANASHEIRTPLSSLIGFIETLQGPARDDPEARAKFLAIMDQNARRMASLVDDLLSLSRIEVKEHQPPEGRVELAPLLDSLRGELAWSAERRDIALDLDLAPGALAVRGEARELAQVFRNLIDNAIKYGRAGGRVRIHARPVEPVPAELRWPSGAPRAIAVGVEDEGEGIAREHLPRLTERFYRVDTARSRELGGTGLGLAIVKHIVARHRGALAIESERGEGSRFTVYLQPAPPEAKTRP